MAQSKAVDIAHVIETQQKSWFSRSIFPMCCLVMLVDGFNQQSLSYAAPAIIRDWGINRALMTVVFDVNIFAWAIGAIGFSMLADRIGRRNSILVAVFTFALFTTAMPLATNLVQLSLIRFVSALGIGGGMPMAISLLAEYAQTKTRGLKITLLYLGYTFGSSGGGFLAAALTPDYGWKSVFLVGGGLSILIGLVLLLALPESVRFLVVKRGAKERILRYARKLKPDADFASDTEFTILESAKEGLPGKHLFTDGRAAMTVFLWFTLGLGFVTHFFLSAWIPTLYSEYSNLMSIPDAQRTLALFQMGSAFGFLVGYVLDKRGIPALIWILLFGALPVAGLGFVHGTGAAMVLALSAGIPVNGSTIGLNAVAGMIYPTFIRSTGTGAAAAATCVGALIGPAIAGYLIYVGTPLPLIFLAAASPVLAAGATAFMLDRSITPTARAAMASHAVLAHH
jgi:MFS transporter, AAHS family, 4-hydroxybenzoate transporter